MDKAELANDGERMIPEFHRNNLFFAEHMTRYTQSLEIVDGMIVLDIASGSGYGTKILSSRAKFVYGVDISREAIKYAKKNYGAKNIEYKLGDGINIPLDNGSVDVVTTYETIEHIADYKKFLSEVKRVLKKDGTVVVSTPNDLEYGEGNHFHLYEFKYKELLSLMKKHFKFVDSYFQSTWRAVLLDKLEGHETDSERTISVKHYSPLRGTDKMLYFYLVCSNKPIKKKLKAILATGPHLSEATEWQLQKNTDKYINELKDQISELNKQIHKCSNNLDTILNSKSYKLARKLQVAKSKALRKLR